MKYKQVLVIKEHPTMALSDIWRSEHADMTTCCIIDQGTSSVLTRFEKNTFYLNEIA